MFRAVPLRLSGTGLVGSLFQATVPGTPSNSLWTKATNLRSRRQSERLLRRRKAKWNDVRHPSHLSECDRLIHSTMRIAARQALRQASPIGWMPNQGPLTLNVTLAFGSAIPCLTCPTHRFSSQSEARPSTMPRHLLLGASH